MKQIMTMYGKFLLEGTVLVLLMTMIFISIEDEEGNKGVFEIVGAKLEIESASHSRYSDFSGTYQAESRKATPKIAYIGGYLQTGICSLSDYIKATDYAGRELPVKITSIRSPQGTEVLDTYDPDTAEINLEQSGIYIVTISVFDDGNRVSNGKVRIPVNK